MKGARRASICSWMSGDIGVDAVDAAEHVRAQEWVMVGEMPAKRSAQLDLLLLTWTGVDLSYGSTADQGRTGRKDSSSRLWRLARALGTHAKQGPSTGHSAVGLRQAGKLCPGRRGHISPRHHARLVTRLLVLRTALLFVRSAVRLAYANSRSRSSSPKQAHCELVPQIFRRAAPSRAGPACFGLGTAVVLPVAGTYRLIETSTTRGERRPSRDLDRGSEHATSDRPILEGCRRLIGCKSPVLAEK